MAVELAGSVDHKLKKKYNVRCQHSIIVPSFLCVCIQCTCKYIHMNMYLQLDKLVQVILSVVHATTSTAKEYESVISSEEKV